MYTPTDLSKRYCPADKHGGNIVHIPANRSLCKTCYEYYGGDISTYPEWLAFMVKDIAREVRTDKARAGEPMYNDDINYDD